jgi:hypothetical protein
MDADRAEAWAMRAFFALTNSGAQIPQQLIDDGPSMAAIAVVGLTGLQGLPYAMAAPLLDELMACAEFVPDASRPQVTLRDLDKHIEEVKTRLYLKARAFVLHTGFSWADALQRVEQQRAAASKKNPTDSSNTATTG